MCKQKWRFARVIQCRNSMIHWLIFFSFFSLKSNLYLILTYLIFSPHKKLRKYLIFTVFFDTILYRSFFSVFRTYLNLTFFGLFLFSICNFRVKQKDRIHCWPLRWQSHLLTSITLYFYHTDRKKINFSNCSLYFDLLTKGDCYQQLQVIINSPNCIFCILH